MATQKKTAASTPTPGTSGRGLRVAVYAVKLFVAEEEEVTSAALFAFFFAFTMTCLHALMFKKLFIFLI